MKIRVLLDTGSQRSYIRKDLADGLGLDGPSESLAVSTLGGVTSTKTLQNVPITLFSKYGYGPVELRALSIERICDPLDALELNTSQFSHLQHLELADEYPRGPVTVDLLIGLDYYYDIVDGGKVVVVVTDVRSPLSLS